MRSVPEATDALLLKLFALCRSEGGEDNEIATLFTGRVQTGWLPCKQLARAPGHRPVRK
jgi:hypothetical protein